MRPVAAIQLRSVSTPMAFVHRPSLGSVLYAATYHLYGRRGPHALRSLLDLLAPPAQRRASSSSVRPSLGKVGVPVFPAIQSIARHVGASNTCSHACLAVPSRWLYESPLRMTSAASEAILLGCASASPHRITAGFNCAVFAGPTPRSPSTRCGLRTSVWPLAAAASAAIMPATPSALDRACPCPQPSATTSTTPRALHFSQSSSLKRRPSAPAAHPCTLARSSGIGRRNLNGEPSFSPIGSAKSLPYGTSVASGATVPDSSLASTARPKRRSRFPQSPRPSAQPSFQPKES